jgi:hypothetical protein
MTASWVRRRRRFRSVCVISVLAAVTFVACKDLGSNAILPDGHTDAGAGSSNVGGESGSRGGSGPSGEGGEAGGGRDSSGGISGTGAGDTGGHAGTDAGGGGDDDGGTGGAAGVARGGTGGSGGASGGGAGGGGEVCREDETIIPECTYLAPVPGSNSLGVGVNAHWSFGGGYHLFASTVSSHTVAISWGSDAQGPAWFPWACFDAVPRAERVASTTLHNELPEIFVTTQCGDLFVRRRVVTSDVDTWSPWSTMRLPRGESFITDVAASVDANHIHHVYVVDAGSVFVRNRVNEDTYASYGSWRGIGSGTFFRTVTAGLRADGRQQVFALDAEGKPRTSVQVSATLGDAFEAWADFGAVGLPPLVDIEAPSGTPAIEVYAIDETGSLWTRWENESGGFSDWAEWQGPEPPEALVALAAAAIPPPGSPELLVAGVGSSGAVYRTRRVNDAWVAWREHPQ